MFLVTFAITAFISLELDNDDKRRYKELGAPVLNMIWMRNRPQFSNSCCKLIHGIGRFLKCLFLTVIFIVLRLFIPIWFMYMLMSTENNKYAFDKMSGLNPCDHDTSYSAFDCIVHQNMVPSQIFRTVFFAKFLRNPG